jgi:hypothetical protein
MALKGTRNPLEESIRYTCESASEAGFLTVVTTVGSGVVLGDRAGKSSIVSNPSGYKVAGLLTHPVESVDETRYERNRHNGATKTGERACLGRKGQWTTNALVSGQSPTDGGVAYLGADGKLTATMSSTGGLVATPMVGAFVGAKDENGYVTVDLNLPVV